MRPQTVTGNYNIVLSSEWQSNNGYSIGGSVLHDEPKKTAAKETIQYMDKN